MAGVIYSNAVAAIHANRLLTQHQVRRMVSAANFDDAARVLFECGYDENTILHAGENEDYIINHEFKKSAALFRELCPDPNLLTSVLLFYDYHNARVLYKARLGGGELYEAVYPFGNFELDNISRAIQKRDYSALPVGMTNALKGLDKLSAPDAAEIDAILGAAMRTDSVSYIKKIKDKNIKKLLERQTTDAHGQNGSAQWGGGKPVQSVSVFSLEFLLNWFILKQQELRTVKTVLMGKKLGLRGKWWEQTNQ